MFIVWATYLWFVVTVQFFRNAIIGGNAIGGLQMENEAFFSPLILNLTHIDSISNSITVHKWLKKTGICSFFFDKYFLHNID